MKIIANNKKAYHNYFIEDTFEAGIELQGWEVKSARAANVSLLESFVFIEGGKASAGGSGSRQAFLKNAHFASYENGVVAEQDTRRDRKLLLSRHQIEKLHDGVKIKGATCVATKIYFNSRGLVKVEVALAKGKHTYDKKQALKEKDLTREAERQYSGKA